MKKPYLVFIILLFSRVLSFAGKVEYNLDGGQYSLIAPSQWEQQDSLQLDLSLVKNGNQIMTYITPLEGQSFSVWVATNILMVRQVMGQDTGVEQKKFPYASVLRQAGLSGEGTMLCYTYSDGTSDLTCMIGLPDSILQLRLHAADPRSLRQYRPVFLKMVRSFMFHQKSGQTKEQGES